MKKNNELQHNEPWIIEEKPYVLAALMRPIICTDCHKEIAGALLGGLFQIQGSAECAECFIAWYASCGIKAELTKHRHNLAVKMLRSGHLYHWNVKFKVNKKKKKKNV